MAAMSGAMAIVPRSCSTCEVDIVGRPVLRGGLPFCCAGCAAGGPCTCSYDRDQGSDDTARAISNVRYCLDVRDLVLMTGPPAPTHGRHARILSRE
jgi:hypothetical protein